MKIPIGIIVQRERRDGRWEAVLWRPVGLIVGGPPSEEWKPLHADGPISRYYAGTLPLRLYPGETEAYRVNLAHESPSVFVVLRRYADTDRPGDVRPILLTASPYESELHLDGGEDIVEPVPMPAPIVGLVHRFVDTHHVERPFFKRRRQ